MLYTDTINSASLRLRESRVVTDLLRREVSDSPWKDQIVGQNALQMGSNESVTSDSKFIKSRMKIKSLGRERGTYKVVELCSGIQGWPLEPQMVVLGRSLGSNVIPAESLVKAPQAADAGEKRILLPLSSRVDIPTILEERLAKFQTSFYEYPRDATLKVLGVQ